MRSLGYIQPNNTAVNVIGCGATGSYATLQLATLGFNVNIYDFDKVEQHNLGNQAYTEDQIGKYKVDALFELCSLKGVALPTTNNTKVDKTFKFCDPTFLLVDTLAARREIFKNCLKLRAKFVVDTRLGIETFQVFCINPFDRDQVIRWNKETEGVDGVDTAEVDRNPCGTQVHIGSSAQLLASVAVWQFINYFKSKPYSTEIHGNCAPFQVYEKS